MKIKKKGPITLFIMGIAAPFQAWGFVRTHKRLIGYFIIPFLINIVLLSAIFYIGFMFVYPFLQQAVPQGDSWYFAVIRLLVAPLIILVLSLICILMYSITGSIITAPFNDPLSQKVENILTGATFDEKFSAGGFFWDMARMFGSIMKMLAITIIFNLVIFFVNLIPVAGGVLYSVLAFMSGLFFIGFSFFEFPLDRRRLSFGSKLRHVWRFKFMTMGIGLGFWIMVMIPFVGFLSLNLTAVGSTRLFVENMQPFVDDKMGREQINDPV